MADVFDSEKTGYSLFAAVLLPWQAYLHA